ncbi:histidine kinase [Brucepastera parasyntrophica]|uniref:sensor histidine kinase n=1 Tax=Brucepastera parasyntrophica TaxID=2880008 RepID=UPI0021092CFE|nr:histidine kinase [Brucepastera parasyntrophica]ULQ60454.1 histidine kinase [Brucepastera parasyntrophica]
MFLTGAGKRLGKIQLSEEVITAVNITMELGNSMIFIILIISLMGKKKRTTQEYLFLIGLALFIIATLSDAAAWAFDTKPGARWISVTGNFLTFLTSPLAYAFFMAYLAFGISVKAKLKNNIIIRIVFFLCAISIFLTTINIFNGMFYSIDKNNVYYWGEWYFLFPGISFIQQILVMILILCSRKSLTKRDTWTYLSYGILPAISLIIGIFFPYLMLENSACMFSVLLIYVNIHQEQEKQLKQRELELAQSRTAIMLSQIQPHFLYNTLTVISSLCTTNPQQARQTILDFSSYLRTNLDSLSNSKPVPFNDELKHTEVYLELEKKRFEERLQVEYAITVRNFSVPSLSLQPIVENAVLHGITTRSAGGTIRIQTDETVSAFLITVADNGVGFDPPMTEKDGRVHIGIENVRQRLALMCAGTLDIQSTPGKGTTVLITIPKGDMS